MKFIKKLIIVFSALCLFSAFSVNAIAENIVTSDIVITKADAKNTQISEEILADSVEENDRSPLKYVIITTASLCALSVLYLAVRTINNNKGNKNDL